jgi:MerR family redox-sensitive transcriptional activator SoxR
MSKQNLAVRAGVAISTLHYYESRGLIRAERSAGNQRRFPRAALRRVAFIRAAQQLGIGLTEVGEALGRLPEQRTPTKADWALLSATWRVELDARIAALQALRNKLDGCIYNPQDEFAKQGSGARRLPELRCAGTGFESGS